MNKDEENAIDDKKMCQEGKIAFWILFLLWPFCFSSLFIDWGAILNTSEPQLFMKILVNAVLILLLGIVAKKFRTKFHFWPWQRR
ncbi:MAG: hypothetical protein NTW06_02555 [Candidatus Falkowbacteria bacterium]|nr:hypothetical protein [Candidatus Falkowbacteria bacterium]